MPGISAIMLTLSQQKLPTTPSRNIFNLSFGSVRLMNNCLTDTSFLTITNEFCFVNKFYHLFPDDLFRDISLLSQ